MDGNAPDPRYWEKMRLVAEVLKAVEGPIYIATHVDPDGDAIGSSLGLYRALKALGKQAYWVAEPPRFLRFFAEGGGVLGSRGQASRGGYPGGPG